MNRNAAPLALLLCAALFFTGCAGKNAASSSPAAVSSAASQQAPRAVSSSSGEEAAQSAVSSQADVPSDAEAGVQNGPVKTIRTNNEEFNKKFQKNPLDAAYVKEMNGAVSTKDMAAVSEKYAGLWQKEIEHAYGALKTALAADSTTKWQSAEDGQKTWESEKAGKLKKIADDAAAAGGSIAKLDAASGTMDFYRDRAAALYLSLYEADPDYTYAAQ